MFCNVFVFVVAVVVVVAVNSNNNSNNNNGKAKTLAIYLQRITWHVKRFIARIFQFSRKRRGRIERGGEKRSSLLAMTRLCDGNMLAWQQKLKNSPNAIAIFS